MKKTVYHYTAPEGAFSILENKTLWFTDCQYLNDMSEIVYITKPFIEAYKRLNEEDGKSNENMESFAEYICGTSPYKDYDLNVNFPRRGWPPEYRYYVLSASLVHDTANMWNYYVKNGVYRGYNLGLDVKIIENWFSKNANDQVQLVHGEVVYDKSKQVNMLYNRMKELAITFKQNTESFPNDPNFDDTPYIDEFQGDLMECVAEKKLFFKHPAYASEKEYRFILKVHNDFKNDNLQLKFRVGSSGIITPYVEWKFGENEKATLLKQITLSPMIEEDLAKASFKQFLLKDIYSNISIVPSSIKLRF